MTHSHDDRHVVIYLPTVHDPPATVGTGKAGSNSQRESCPGDDVSKYLQYGRHSDFLMSPMAREAYIEIEGLDVAHICGDTPTQIAT